jgi:hypothetical protein
MDTATSRGFDQLKTRAARNGAGASNSPVVHPSPSDQPFIPHVLHTHTHTHTHTHIYIYTLTGEYYSARLPKYPQAPHTDGLPHQL